MNYPGASRSVKLNARLCQASTIVAKAVSEKGFCRSFDRRPNGRINIVPGFYSALYWFLRQPSDKVAVRIG